MAACAISISLGTRVRMFVSLCGMATHYSRTGEHGRSALSRAVIAGITGATYVYEDWSPFRMNFSARRKRRRRSCAYPAANSMQVRSPNSWTGSDPNRSRAPQPSLFEARFQARSCFGTLDARKPSESTLVAGVRFAACSGLGRPYFLTSVSSDSRGA